MPPPKKREKDASTMPTTIEVPVSTIAAPPSDGTLEATKSNQQDNDLFLQAFEKPTQIYRYLRNRHSTFPIFLYRTLSYMKDRLSTNNKRRSTFKINSMLHILQDKLKTEANKNLNLFFLGLFDTSPNKNQLWKKGDLVRVDLMLFKITKSKRKESTSDFKEVWRHSSELVYNSCDCEDNHYCAGISVPVQYMSPIYDQHIIYKLIFRIEIPKSSDTTLMENGDASEMQIKFREGKIKGFVSELIIFDKYSGMISEGDYESTFQEYNATSIKSYSPKKRTWEVLPCDYLPLSEKFNAYDNFFTMKYRLIWGANPIPNNIDTKSLCDLANFISMPVSKEGDAASSGDGIDDTTINNNNNLIDKNDVMPTYKSDQFEIVFNFLYSNNTRQQTEYTCTAVCPWCTLDCLQLYPLLKHLKLCHSRFRFTYQSTGVDGALIDVTVNDSYDGSYAGSSYDLAGPSGSSFARVCGPVRRTTVTNFLVCRPRRHKMSLDEFTVHDEDDLSNQRPYITGHSRLYHHTETCLPVHPKELDNDSEGESDPMWLRQKTIQMIDEFSDVNEGEKELMKLWNLHMMKYGYVGECQLPLSCEMFIEMNWRDIFQKNLYRNFVLHMGSLADYGLVSAEIVLKAIQKLKGKLSKDPECLNMMSKHRDIQLKYWLEVGIHKQDEQKLKSPLKIGPNAKSGADATSTNVAGHGQLQHELMQPPTKRSTNAVKRASMHPHNISSTSEKMGNSSGSGVVKSGVAKKSVLQEDEPNGSVTREKRAETLNRKSLNCTPTATGIGEKERSEMKTGDKTRSAGEIKSQPKRRLSGKEITIQPTSKRNRNDNSPQNQSTARRSSMKQDVKNTLVAPQARPASSSSTTALPKRLVTRRQTLSSFVPNPNAAEILAATLKNTKTTHALRTRVSMPLTKNDKR